MQDFVVSLLDLCENCLNLLFDLGRGAGAVGDELDQVACLLQESLYLGKVGNVVLTAVKRDG